MDTIEFGSSSVTGQLHENEDRITLEPNLLGDGEIPFSFFGVFDGHGGERTVDFVKEYLHCHIASKNDEKKFADRSDEEISDAIREGFAIADNEVIETLREARDFSGSCACCVVVVKQKIFVANLGDSRVVLAQKRPGNKLGAVALSTDHKPKNEKQRVVDSGGWVSRDGRINGVLSCSRAFGDREFKYRQDALLLDANFGSKSPRKGRKRFLSNSPDVDKGKPQPSDKEELELVLSDPEISIQAITDDELFLIIASDGFWEIFSTKKCVELAVTFLREGSTLDETARRLCDKAVKGGTKDDVSVVIVVINKKELNSIIIKKSQGKGSEQQEAQ